MTTSSLHESTQHVGILLTNLGTPSAPTPIAVRVYLKEFLSDSRVVKMPKLLWWPLLHGVILNTRPKRAAKAYDKIWTDEGSPLLTISKQQAKALQNALDEQDRKYSVELAMRYGEPSIMRGLEALKAKGAQRIIVLPLYPQFSDTTTSSTFDAVNRAMSESIPLPIFIKHYHNHPDYISAMANSIKEHWDEYGQVAKLLMSFHGIPQDYADAGDPYPDECRETAQLLAKALKLNKQDWLLTFQSRLGQKKWLQPYTDKSLLDLAASGVKRVQVVCPGFSADCLETLEEIDKQNRKVFLDAGGESYEYIPCLNDREDHIKLMTSLVMQHSVA